MAEMDTPFVDVDVDREFGVLEIILMPLLLPGVFAAVFCLRVGMWVEEKYREVF
ncbi:hypothetical protein [Natrinema versiforme]|uniref:hypothetical protein n=1 Tax=Natrinema versiforme TaxID=88724 RepID=UPI00135F1779|nr:hypothetical protein [Natrinema versiforme]